MRFVHCGRFAMERLERYLFALHVLQLPIIQRGRVAMERLERDGFDLHVSRLPILQMRTCRNGTSRTQFI
jgi:hypothetical protein